MRLSGAEMSVRILVGDCRQLLKGLASGSVHCCVTSPPYWGLRDYGTAAWQGGSPDCNHRGRDQTSASSTLAEWKSGGGKRYKENAGGMPFAVSCKRCGAIRTDAQLGLEQSPDDYVARMVEVFGEVRRVLRDDGTLWLNIGDSYTDSGRGSDVGSTLQGTRHNQRESRKTRVRETSRTGLGPKNLVGIPWMLAFALRADGWILRSEIIWHKQNPMPESVRDRPTKAHEQIFLLAKSERYYYDQEATLEPASPNTHARIAQDIASQVGSARANGGTRAERPMKAVVRGGVGRKTKATLHGSGIRANEDFTSRTSAHVVERRNKRSVWTVTTRGFSGAHFATFPPALIEPCVLAGSPRGGTVLDPFGGAGTTGLVADRHGRNATLIELNPHYARLAHQRIHSDAPLFAEAAHQ